MGGSAVSAEIMGERKPVLDLLEDGDFDLVRHGPKLNMKTEDSK